MKTTHLISQQRTYNPISTKNTAYNYTSQNQDRPREAHTMSYDLPQGGRRNSGAAGGRRINSTRARINATRRRCQHKSLASFHVHSKWSQTPLNRTKRFHTLWIFLTLEFAGNWYHLSMAKSANSSNNWKSRSMLRLGCKRPAGTRKFGGTSGTRAICLPPPNRTSDQNGDNKSKPLNITDTHHNNILYTPTISPTQTSDQDYLTRDNKREHTTVIFTSDKSNNRINQIHRRQHGEKGREKDRTRK